jgi:uncharacterized membrane protein
MVRFVAVADAIARHAAPANASVLPHEPAIASGAPDGEEYPMTRILERSIDVDAPASTAYNAWTQFELFPHFMEHVQMVRQTDDRHLQWRAKILGHTEEWDAEITEQIPDKRIAWRSKGGASNAGAVTFHRLSDDRSRVMLQLAYEPEGWREKLAGWLGILGHRIADDLEDFKHFVEKYGHRFEGWRGDVQAKPDAGQPYRASA